MPNLYKDVEYAFVCLFACLFLFFPCFLVLYFFKFPKHDSFWRNMDNVSHLLLKNQLTKGDPGTNPKLIWKLKGIWLW